MRIEPARRSQETTKMSNASAIIAEYKSFIKSRCEIITSINHRRFNAFPTDKTKSLLTDGACPKILSNKTVSDQLFVFQADVGVEPC